MGTTFELDRKACRSAAIRGGRPECLSHEGAGFAYNEKFAGKSEAPPGWCAARRESECYSTWLKFRKFCRTAIRS